jgi:hypothetical protein
MVVSAVKYMMHEVGDMAQKVRFLIIFLCVLLYLFLEKLYDEFAKNNALYICHVLR